MERFSHVSIVMAGSYKPTKYFWVKQGTLIQLVQFTLEKNGN